MRTDEPADGGGTERYRRQRRIQEATYAIAHAVTTTAGLDDLFARIHRIVGGLMEARNLYIALLDEATGSLSFPYFRDEIDAEPPAGPVPAGREATAAGTRQRRALHVVPALRPRVEIVHGARIAPAVPLPASLPSLQAAAVEPRQRQGPDLGRWQGLRGQRGVKARPQGVKAIAPGQAGIDDLVTFLSDIHV